MPDWRVNARRFSNFVRTLFKSKMAIVGLIVLIVYAFFAVAAPIVTPYDPQHDIVAGAYSPPSWYRYLNEGSGLSQNMIVEPHPDFPSDPVLQGWQFSASNSHVTESYDRTISTQVDSGSVKIMLDRSGVPGNYSATFKKVFNWPYTGPPARFSARISIYTPSATIQEPVHATVFIERITHDHKVWNITDNTPANSTSGSSNLSWANYPLTTNAWQAPISIDSQDSAMRQILGIPDVDPAALTFSSQDDYAYGVTVTLSSASTSATPASVYLDDMSLRLYGSSWGLLGTDVYGFDIWSQLIYGARISLAVGLLAAFIGIALGLVVGLIAGYLGKVVDEVLMRFTDMLLVIPGLPLLIVLVAVIGNSLGPSRLAVLIIIIGFLGWMGFARVVRAQVLSLKERPFVEAARAAGAGAGHIATRHIIPNIVGLIYVNLALAVPGAILTEAALSFLGLGDVTVVSWGRMLNAVEENGAQQIWWWVLPPGLSIALVSLAFVLIGFSMDTLFNPRLRQRR